MSATALSVDSETALSSDLNEVSDATRMATSLPGTKHMFIVHKQPFQLLHNADVSKKKR